MKKILFITVACFIFLFPHTVNAEEIFYNNELNHYSFSIPDGWKKIDKKIIDIAFKGTIQNIEGVEYITGFQLKDVPDFDYPYILVQEHEFNTPSHNQLIKAFGDGEIFEEVNKKIDEYSEIITNGTVQDPYIDKERNILFINGEVDVVGVGKVNAFMVMFLGKESVAQLNFYSKKSEYSENLPIFSQIIDSFKYEREYKYSEIEAKKNDSKGIFDGVIEKGIIGGIAGAFIALFIGLFKKNKPKQTEQNTSKNCAQCGDKLKGNTVFCPKCGNKI